jgi:hypothetical protein
LYRQDAAQREARRGDMIAFAARLVDVPKAHLAISASIVKLTRELPDHRFRI